MCSRKASAASSGRASSGQLSEAPSNAAAMPPLRSQPSGGAAAMPSTAQEPDAASPPQGESYAPARHEPFDGCIVLSARYMSNSDALGCLELSMFHMKFRCHMLSICMCNCRWTDIGQYAGADVSLAVRSCTKEGLYVLSGSHMHLLCTTSVSRECTSEIVTPRDCHSKTEAHRLCILQNHVSESVIK